jgi:hypothetical protein
MKRNRRVIFLIAAILSCAFPLLWSSTQLTPLAVEVGWLVLGCLIGLGTPLQFPELLLLVAILTPGLFITLTTHADLNTFQSYRSVGHVVFTLGLYAALISLSELIKSTTVRLLLRICLILAIPLLFALGLERSSALLPLSLAALGWVLLMFLRSMRSRAS